MDSSRNHTCSGSWRKIRSATGKLPHNIGQITRTIIKAAGRDGASSLQEQLDYALRLVCWSWIARECGVQIELIDVLVDAGASLDGRRVYQGHCGAHCDSAVFNGNFAAAEHLLERGAPLTLSAALCLGRWADVERLARAATLAEKQDAFVLAALNGKAEALGRMLALGVDPTTVSTQNYSHATALHHAVCSGSIDAVKVLVEAGADLTRRDTVYDATPLGWAAYYEQEQKDKSRAKQFTEIAAYLREKGVQEPCHTDWAVPGCDKRRSAISLMWTARGCCHSREVIRNGCVY